MILGRPTNLWLGAFTAVFGVVTLILAALVPPIVIPAVVVSGLTIAVGSLIGLVAYQPPTLTPGDTFITQTAKGQPNYSTTVETPPQPSTPVPTE